MAIIFETRNYLVEAADQPLVTRLDGGHITITPRKRVVDRTRLSPRLAIELMRLTMIVGEAMSVGLSQRGIPIRRINYQDNGNWGFLSPLGPHLHVHLYGRAANARFQPFGEACHFPQRDSRFYDNFEPLNSGDIAEVRKQIDILRKESKYQVKNWCL
jgi:diadenosine tetraphosphate (Ap4A) HIT family hydrolase